MYTAYTLHSISLHKLVNQWALNQLSLEFLLAKRNAIERYFRTLKERLKGFYDNIDVKKLIGSWLKSF